MCAFRHATHADFVRWTQQCTQVVIGFSLARMACCLNHPVLGRLVGMHDGTHACLLHGMLHAPFDKSQGTLDTP